MIVTWFLEFVAWLLDTVFSAWPKVTELPETWQDLENTLAVISGLAALPIIGTALQISMLVLAFVSVWQAIVFANWIYNKIRGSG